MMIENLLMYCKCTEIQIFRNSINSVIQSLEYFLLWIEESEIEY